MIKNILSVAIFLLLISFFYFVLSSYFSNNQELMIKKNRERSLHELKNKIAELPILINNTNNVIEFNSGFDIHNNKIERNFWNLFK